MYITSWKYLYIHTYHTLQSYRAFKIFVQGHQQHFYKWLNLYFPLTFLCQRLGFHINHCENVNNYKTQKNNFSQIQWNFDRNSYPFRHWNFKNKFETTECFCSCLLVYPKRYLQSQNKSSFMEFKKILDEIFVTRLHSIERLPKTSFIGLCNVYTFIIEWMHESVYMYIRMWRSKGYVF